MDSRNAGSESVAEEVKSFFESAPPLKNNDLISQQLKDFTDRNYHSSGIQLLSLFPIYFYCLIFSLVVEMSNFTCF